MKNLSPILALIVLFVSCSQPSKPAVDVEAAKKEVSALLDQFHQAMWDKDAAGQMALLTEDAIFCGTDPSEVWNKQAITEYLTKGFADTTWTMPKYGIDKREIKIDDDGQCAYAIDQFTFGMLSNQVPTRLHVHAVNQDGQWRFDFLSLAMIPLNKDLGKLDSLLTK